MSGMRDAIMTRLLNIATALSFAGLVLTCFAWGLTSSRFMADGFDLSWNRVGRISVRYGFVVLAHPCPEPMPQPTDRTALYGGTPLALVLTRTADGGLVFVGVGAKLWLVAATLATLPLIGVATSRRRRRAYRRKQGLCERCGYDLRGSPEQRCPECGVKA
jgi:hypothetical protein